MTPRLSARNHWPDAKCARAFWGQQTLPSYQRLLRDTVAWLDPQPGERWLDLGCGSGQLTEALWTKSAGQLHEIIALDCAAENAKVFRKLRGRLLDDPNDGRIAFVCADFSLGLDQWPDRHFHGVCSGLSLQYAESFSEEAGVWTTEAYDRLLGDLYRVLDRDGRLVFSVNVPEPAWSMVALHSLGSVFRTRQPGRFLRQSWRMMRYGSWLKREARRGRFHYLPLSSILSKLRTVGFTAIDHRLTYARQAYLIRCRKPA
jgi:ubiquinone/menaquinone biosynthesis C-methylase UbiE